MLAVDTNVVVRFLVRDDTRQTARADELFRENRIWIPQTVLLETEWVLRSVYRLDPRRIEEVIRGLGGVPTVVFEDDEDVAHALDWFAAGMDFADALHLASIGPASEFVTFDRKLAASAARAGVVPKVRLL